MIYWILGILALLVLGFVFRKHLKKFAIAIAVIIGGWFGLNDTEVILPTDPVIETPIDSTDGSDTLVIPEKPVGKVFYIELSEEGDQTTPLQAQLDAIPDGIGFQTDSEKSFSILKKVAGPKWSEWTFEVLGFGDRIFNTIVFPEGRFWTEGNRNGIIRLQDRHNLIIKGNNTTFYTKAPAVPYESLIDKNQQSERRHFWIIQSSNLVLQNIRVEGSNTIDGRLISTTPELTPYFWKGGVAEGSIDGAHAYWPPWEQEHAFDVRASENIIIEDCEVYGVWGDGVYVGEWLISENTAIPSKNIIIRNNHLKFTGRQGIAVCNSADGILIEGNHIEKGSRSSIDLEPYTPWGYVRNVVIRNNKLHAVFTAVAALGYGDVSNIQILDNEFSGGGFVIAGDSHPVSPQRRKNWTVKRNVRTNGFGSFIASSSLRRIDNILYEGNDDKISHVLSKRSIDFFNCGGEILVIDNNFLSGNILLKLEGTTEVIARNNTPEQIIINSPN